MPEGIGVAHTILAARDLLWTIGFAVWVVWNEEKEKMREEDDERERR